MKKFLNVIKVAITVTLMAISAYELGAFMNGQTMLEPYVQACEMMGIQGQYQILAIFGYFTVICLTVWIGGVPTLVEIFERKAAD